MDFKRFKARTNKEIVWEQKETHWNHYVLLHSGSFYEIPSWHMINQMYYGQDKADVKRTADSLRFFNNFPQYSHVGSSATADLIKIGFSISLSL